MKNNFIKILTPLITAIAFFFGFGATKAPATNSQAPVQSNLERRLTRVREVVEANQALESQSIALERSATIETQTNSQNDASRTRGQDMSPAVEPSPPTTPPPEPRRTSTHPTPTPSWGNWHNYPNQK